jgi:transposase
MIFLKPFIGGYLRRGPDLQQTAMFRYLTLERRVPADHPLRGIRRLTDRALERMSGELGKLYAATGRPSIAPERLLRALLLGVNPTLVSPAAK